MESIQNSGQIIFYFPYWITYFVKEPEFSFGSALDDLDYTALFTVPLRYTFVHVLTMLMDFLWLVYSKYEYKYVIIRWTCYIVIRALFVFLVAYGVYSTGTISDDYQIIFCDFVNFLIAILPIIDFIQFVYCARKFYLHLKSREKEIRLFYFDQKSYLDIKYLRIHFKTRLICIYVRIYIYVCMFRID